MAHIQLPEGLPGIVGPLALSPGTARPLLGLAETFLRGPNTLTSGERETIAAHVSYRNECDFCQLSHGAAAAAHLEGSCLKKGVVRQRNYGTKFPRTQEVRPGRAVLQDWHVLRAIERYDSYSSVERRHIVR
jgi:AhpD family alkylhydroperoxidase